MSRGHGRGVVAVIGGILGVLVGFAIGVVFTEIVFANNASWPDVVPFALAVAGALAGSQLGGRFSAHRAKTHRTA